MLYELGFFANRSGNNAQLSVVIPAMDPTECKASNDCSIVFYSSFHGFKERLVNAQLEGEIAVAIHDAAQLAIESPERLVRLKAIHLDAVQLGKLGFTVMAVRLQDDAAGEV